MALMVNLKRHLLETATLVAAATVCAFVANAFASSQRKVRVVEPPLPTRAPTAAVSGNGSTGGAAPNPAVAGVVEPTPNLAPPPVTASTTAPPAPSPAKPAAGASPASTAAKPAEAKPSEKAKASPAELLARFPPNPDKPYREISGDDVSWLHAQGVLFLDARRSNVFAEGHIAGARPFSVWEGDLSDKLLALSNEGRNGDLPVVIYCAGGECEDSHLLSERLFSLGFANALVYRDGWPDWQKRGGPGKTGNEP